MDDIKHLANDGRMGFVKCHGCGWLFGYIRRRGENIEQIVRRVKQRHQTQSMIFTHWAKPYINRCYIT